MLCVNQPKQPLWNMSLVTGTSSKRVSLMQTWIQETLQKFHDPNYCFIIAEAGVNHNGDLDLALDLVDIAARSGADAVKFQTFKPGELTGAFTPNVGYIDAVDAKPRDQLTKQLALDFECFRELKRCAEERGLLFLSTPDGYQSLDFLNDELDIPIIKIGSSEITHSRFLSAIGACGKPVILSTGISSIDEVRKAYKCVYEPLCVPITVLQCTSEYPAPDDEINIRAMHHIRDILGCNIGLSDHSIGNEAALASLALGASVVEKHFTFDVNAPGPDHQASLSPEELKQFVISMRRLSCMLGDGVKRPMLSELSNIKGVRRGVVAACNLKKGTVICERDLDFKRPFVGVNPDEASHFIGRKLNRSMKFEEPLTWNDLE